MSLLWRLARVQTGPDGTFGVMGLADDPPRWLTLERPWYNNEQEVSCIQDGTYDLIPYPSTHFGKVWAVQNVVGRTAILIHPANRAEELRGCIALGMRYGELDHRPAILESQPAVAEFHNMMKGLTQGKLQIRWAL